MAVGQTKPALACPSLYSTIRLAHLVQSIKDRLKSLIQKQDGPRGSPPYSKDRRQSIYAAKDAIKSEPCRTLTDPVRRRCGLRHLLSSESGCTGYAIPQRSRGTNADSFPISLLRDIDSHTPFGNLSLCKNASQDSLFLRHSFHQIKNAKTLVPLHRVYDLTTALLNRMKCLRQRLAEEDEKSLFSFGLDLDDVMSDEFFANLEHLLRCLQQVALDAIVCLCLSLFVADLFRWHHRQRDADGWFAEWPNAQHPLNTTWPWNVKTALLVLWGVCWMFYGNGSAGKPFHDPQPPNPYEQDFRTGQPSQPSPPTSQPQTIAALSSPATYSNFSWLHPAQAGTLPRRASIRNPGNATRATQPAYPTSVSTYPYITASPYVSSDLFPASTVAWPYAPGSNEPPTSINTATANPWQSTHNNFGPFTETPRRIESFSPVDSFPPSGRAQEYQPQLQRTTSQSPGSTLTSLGFTLPLDLQMNMQNYPSPQYSDFSGPTWPAHQKMVPGAMMSPGIRGEPSPSNAGSSESRQSSHRSLEPTRNADGLFVCNHSLHGSNPRTFTRKCEWSKHMDTHTRPHICEEPGCENIQGFTYSGGLHRHQREVHRKHGGPKAKCMCPHQDCKRSTGLGFSRRENLLEHLRRVHRDVPAENKQEGAGEQSLPKPGESRKRRRRIDEIDGDATSGNDHGQSPQSLKEEVKRLRQELQEKDERLQRLEAQMEQFMKGAQALRKS